MIFTRNKILNFSAGKSAVLLLAREIFDFISVKTPRMWGWTVTLPDFGAMADENPTYVGMDRLVKAPVLHKECKPHVCGDGPILDEQEVRLTQ